ncbi:MAG: class I SAM-dependent methyltransferase [Dehalococcoidia bacterium]
MKMSRIEKFFVNSERRQRSRVALAQKLLAGVPLDGVTEVLEVGCGMGTVARHLAESYRFNVTGIDIDPDQITLAKQRSAGIDNPRFLEADVTKLPFEDHHFDVVLSFMVMHHVDGWSAALSEIRRVLKPGGNFIYADILLSAPATWISAAFGHSYRLPALDRLTSSMEASGFSAVSASRSRSPVVSSYQAVYKG